MAPVRGEHAVGQADGPLGAVVVAGPEDAGPAAQVLAHGPRRREQEGGEIEHGGLPVGFGHANEVIDTSARPRRARGADRRGRATTVILSE